MTGFDPSTLPNHLPVAEDDGAADHLPGAALPAIALPATDGGEHVFYPVFPPDGHAAEVLAWLRAHPS